MTENKIEMQSDLKSSFGKANDMMSAAIDQSFFDSKIDALFQTELENLYTTPEHQHRFDNYKLDPRTLLKDGQVFCEDGELNDLIQKETAENRKIYDRLLEEEKQKQNSGEPNRNCSFGFSLSSLFRTKNIDKRFNQLKHDKYITQYQDHTDRLRTFSHQISVANQIALDKRAIFNVQLNIVKKELGVDSFDLKDVLKAKNPTPDQLKLAIDAKYLLSAESILSNKLSEAAKNVANGLLDTANVNNAEQFSHQMESIDSDAMKTNLHNLTVALDPGFDNKEESQEEQEAKKELAKRISETIDNILRLLTGKSGNNESSNSPSMN